MVAVGVVYMTRWIFTSMSRSAVLLPAAWLVFHACSLRILMDDYMRER